MNTPDLPGQMAKKTDAELSALLKRPEDWTPEALEAARAELRRRGIDPDSIKPTPLEVAADESPEAGQLPDAAAAEEPKKQPLSYQQQAHIGVASAFIAWFVFRMLHVWDDVSGARPVELMTLLICDGMFIWGCIGYAAGKGYSKWLGALGALCCGGLLILILLPDRRKEFDDHES